MPTSQIGEYIFATIEDKLEPFPDDPAVEVEVVFNRVSEEYLRRLMREAGLEVE